MVLLFSVAACLKTGPFLLVTLAIMPLRWLGYCASISLVENYSSVWIVTVNGKSKSKDTKRNLVLEPAAYWRLFPHPCLEQSVQQKLGRIQDVRTVETGVVVSTTARGEPDLTLRFDGLGTVCTDTNPQLTEWSGLHKEGFVPHILGNGSHAQIMGFRFEQY